jgi:hypothetical protein
MAANDKSRKSTKRRASGSRSSSEGAGARKSASRSRSGGAEDESRRGGKAASGSMRQAGEGGGRSGGARKSAAKKSSSRGAAGESRGGSQERGAKGRKSESRETGRAQSGSRGRKSAGTARGRMDALKLLKEDHDRVDEMFKRYDRMKEGDERKQQLLQTILEEVRVHAQVEEELFYPALSALFEEGGKDKERELIEEADVEHETVKWLMEQLEGEQSDEGMRDARVKVMGEYIRHHVEEEEGQIFKAAKKVDLDLEELGRQMDARKRQLKGEEPADQEGAGDGDMQVSEPAQMATSGSRTHCREAAPTAGLSARSAFGPVRGERAGGGAKSRPAWDPCSMTTTAASNAVFPSNTHVDARRSGRRPR